MRRGGRLNASSVRSKGAGALKTGAAGITVTRAAEPEGYRLFMRNS